MKKNAIITQKFSLEISVNIEEISTKYPNFNINFNNVDDFIKFIINDMKYSGEIDLSKEAMEKFGYSIQINATK